MQIVLLGFTVGILAVAALSYAAEPVCPFGKVGFNDVQGDYSVFSPCKNLFSLIEGVTTLGCYRVCNIDSDCVGFLYSDVTNQCFIWSLDKTKRYGCICGDSHANQCSNEHPCTPLYKICKCTNGNTLAANSYGANCKTTPTKALSKCPRPSLVADVGIAGFSGAVENESPK